MLKEKKYQDLNLLITIQEIFFKNLDLDETLLEIVNCCGKKFNVSRFMIGIFDQNIDEYTFQYIYYQNKKIKNNSSPMTMQGKKIIQDLEIL